MAPALPRPSATAPLFRTIVDWVCSVEGSTIIVAACIPVLKPLWDYAATNCCPLPCIRSLSRTYWKRSGSASQQNQLKLDSLSRGDGAAAGEGRNHHDQQRQLNLRRHNQRQQQQQQIYADLDFASDTVILGGGGTISGSQDTMLHVESEAEVGLDDEIKHQGDGILRTDRIEISYESAEATSKVPATVV